MKIRTFALAALAATFVAGTAMAQSNGTGSGTGQNGPTSTMGTGSQSDMQGGSSSMKGKSDMTTTNSTSGSMYKSDDEKMMYQNNADMMRPFFTDSSMSTLKSKSEIKSTYEGMSSAQQAKLMKSCDNAKSQRGSYGTMTNTLCESIGTM